MCICDCEWVCVMYVCTYVCVCVWGGGGHVCACMYLYRVRHMFVCVLLFSAVPSSVLMALPLHHLSQHSYNQQHSNSCWARPLEVQGRRRPIVGRLPSKGDTALLLNHLGVQWCLFSDWIICRTPPAMAPADDIDSQAMEPNWVSIPSTGSRQ